MLKFLLNAPVSMSCAFLFFFYSAYINCCVKLAGKVGKASMPIACTAAMPNSMCERRWQCSRKTPGSCAFIRSTNQPPIEPNGTVVFETAEPLYEEYTECMC